MTIGTGSFAVCTPTIRMRCMRRSLGLRMVFQGTCLSHALQLRKLVCRRFCLQRVCPASMRVKRSIWAPDPPAAATMIRPDGASIGPPPIDGMQAREHVPAGPAFVDEVSDRGPVRQRNSRTAIAEKMQPGAGLSTSCLSMRLLGKGLWRRKRPPFANFEQLRRFLRSVLMVPLP